MLLRGRSRAFEKRVKGKKGQGREEKYTWKGMLQRGDLQREKDKDKKEQSEGKPKSAVKARRGFKEKKKKKRSTVCSALLGFQRGKIKEG